MEHCLIIGAGLTGAALAYELSLGGARVTVLEAGMQAASQASGRSFGWINASFALNAAHHALRVEGIAAHHRLEVRLANQMPEPLWDWPGCLWWEKEGAALDAMAEGLLAQGYETQVLDRAEVAQREPALAAPPERALFFPQEGAVDPAGLTRVLLAAAAARGAEVYFGLGASALVETGGVVTGALTAGGVIAADQVIVAAGTGAAALLAGVGRVLPMLPRPGMILTTQPVPRILHHVLGMPGQDLRQDRMGRLIMPLATNHQADPTETAPEDPQALVAESLARLNGLFTGKSFAAEQVALAWRPVPGDGLPAVGRVAPGLWLAVMHSGITLAPVVAELLTSEILGGQAAPLLASFAPGRFWA